MTTERSETYQADVLIEARDLDLAANTFTRRDGSGTVVEVRALTVREVARLNAKAAQDVRNAAFRTARTNANALGASPIKDILTVIMDELELIR